MDIKHVGDHECINCGECIPACPTKAITWKGSKIFLYGIKEETDECEVEAAPLNALVSGGTTAVTAEVNTRAVTDSVEQTTAVHEEKPAQTAAVQEETSVQTATADRHAEYLARVKKRGFWVQFTAWALALAVLVGALVYFNFIDKTIDKAVSATTYNVGDACPDFTLSTVYETPGAYIDGEKIEKFTLSDYAGKVVVLNFWYSTCDPCKAELPHFDKVQKDYQGSVVTIVIHTVNSQFNASALTVQGTIDHELDGANSSLIFVHDELEVNCIEMLGGKDAYPRTVILDGSGVITFTRTNSLNEATLRSEIDKALNN